MTVDQSSFFRMLASSVVIQEQISKILEAKAAEAEKSKKWVLAYPEFEHHFETTIELHEQVIDMLESISKVQSGLNRNMKLLLEPVEQEEEDMDFKSLFSGGDED